MQDPAELYYLPDDFSQAKDLAAEHPEKVQELKELFWQEAEQYKVLPLLATLSTFFGILPPIADETTFEFRGDVQNVLSGMIPRIYNHSYSITADLVIPDGGAEGVIVAEADHLGGFSLFVKDGKLTHTYSMMGVFVFRQVAEEDLPDRRGHGADGVRRRRGEARHRRRGDAVHRRPAGRARAAWTTPSRSASPATPAWTSAATTAGWSISRYEDRKPFAFTGTIKKVVFDIKPHPSDEDAQELHTRPPPRARRARAVGLSSADEEDPMAR